MKARPDYLPTPQQIAAECERIRLRWSPAERQRRTVGFALETTQRMWLPPRIDTSLCYNRVRKMASEQSS